MNPAGAVAARNLSDATGKLVMIRLFSIMCFIVFVGVLSWYITNQLKEAYTILKNNGMLNTAKPLFLGITFCLFVMASIQSFLERPDDLPSHLLLIITTLLLSLALAVNKASVRGLIDETRRLFLKLKFTIANHLIKFGKKR